jgi:hypothetical protein
MNTKLQEILKEELLKLPRDLQQAINSFDWMSECEQIGEKHNLLDSEIADFQTETALIFLGLVLPDNYAKNIENEIGMSKGEAENLADEVLQKIFMPIADRREEIIKVNVKNRPPAWDKEMQFVLSGGDYSYLGDKPMADAIREGVKPISNPQIKNNV